MSTNNYIPFKTKFTLEERKTESARIKEKYPTRIPIIVECIDKNNKIHQIDKHKFLTPTNLTFGQFAYVIRKRLKIDSDIGIFYLINNKMFTMSESIASICANEVDEDGFLYIHYSGENTFG
tara:strand:- start:1039 stop:1404 length:366 start_codon:yes stop_codon:yes gene_type:complete